MADTTMDRESTAIDALFKNFARLGREGVPTLLIPWLAIAAVDFGFVALSLAVFWIAGAASTGAGIAVQAIALVQGILVMTLRVALLKTLRDVAFGGASSVSNFGGVVRGVLGRLGPAFVVTISVGLIVTVGFMLCVLPGLVALFFLAFAPYLVVARKIPLGESFKTSAQWAQKEWVLLLTAIAVGVLATGFVACVMALFGGVDVQAGVGVPASLLSGWVLSTVLGYLAFLWWGAVYVTAESRRQVESLRRTAPDTGGEGFNPPQGPATYQSPPPSSSPPDGGEW